MAQVQYGSMVDNRDNHTYRTVKIGNKVWMAENMAIKAGESYPPNGDYDNIPIYGRLYTWQAAKTVCPIGWRLPSRNDFIQLLQTVCGNCSTGEMGLIICKNKCNFGVFNNRGFGALPAGDYYSGNYLNFGNIGYWWSATEYDSSLAYSLKLGYGYANVDYYNIKTYGFSVRCLRD